VKETTRLDTKYGGTWRALQAIKAHGLSGVRGGSSGGRVGEESVDHFEQFCEDDGLSEDAVHTVILDHLKDVNAFVHMEGGHHDHFNGIASAVEVLDEFDSRLARHINVGNQDIRTVLLEHSKALLAVPGAKRVPNDGFVVYDDNVEFLGQSQS
tara:strand:+ start:3084 stop:3545 length:462 start_codon:yes stop_codon:yes gene_type:complete